MLRRRWAKRRASKKLPALIVSNKETVQDTLRQRARPVHDEVPKDVLISKLVAARAKIVEAARALPAGRRDEVFLGEWSVMDLLAHLIGWDYTYPGAVDELLLGERPSFYAQYDEDWATYNRYLVRQYFRPDWAELLGAVNESHQKLLDYLQTLPEDEFNKDHGVHEAGKPLTIARLLKGEVKDNEEHYRQIREWMREESK